jgi:hypothetical protein
MVSKQTKKDLIANKGTKDDRGKCPTTLLDPYFLEELAFHMQKGLEKYKRGNWQNALNPERILRAIDRHSLQIRKEEVIDYETGSNHSIAIAANAMMLYFAERHGLYVRTEHSKG